MTLCGVGGWGGVGWVGWGGVGGYDQLCCPASPKLLLGLDLGLGCDNRWYLTTAEANYTMIVRILKLLYSN